MSVLEQFRKQIAARRRRFEAHSQAQRADFEAQNAQARRRFEADQAHNGSVFQKNARSANDLLAAAQPERERLQATGQALSESAGRVPAAEPLRERLQQAERAQQHRTEAFSRELATADTRLSGKRLPE